MHPHQASAGHQYATPTGSLYLPAQLRTEVGNRYQVLRYSNLNTREGYLTEVNTRRGRSEQRP